MLRVILCTLKRKKAAPRFELGIKDLQSSALPLGHAADPGVKLPISDRTSRPHDNSPAAAQQWPWGRPNRDADY